MNVPRRPRVLITGVDSMLGSNIALRLSRCFDVVGLHRRRGVQLDIARSHVWCSANDLTELLLLERPAYAVHCGAAARSAWDQIASDRATDDGAQAEPGRLRLLCELTRRIGSHLTVLTSDRVFGGPRMFHEERAAENFRSSPEAQAAGAVESLAQEFDALVVRTHAYGWSPQGADSYPAEMFQRISQGRPVRTSDCAYATPILATDLADCIASAWQNELRGLWHIAGAERTSHAEFAIALAEAFGLRASDAQLRVVRHRAGPAADTSLSSVRARAALGRPLPMLREGLERFARQAADGFRLRMQHRKQTETRLVA